MSNLPSLLLDEFDLPDWDALNPAQVELLPEQMQQAAQLSQAVLNRDQRWKVYHSALGLFGFQQWLSERSPELSTQFEQASIRSSYANVMAEVWQIQVGAFKICLIPIGYANQVDVSIAAFELPDFAAHFYVLTQAIDEEERVSISGFLTYNQFRQHTLRANSDWTYSLPLDWFNTDANTLLLNLRCLEPSAIRLPALEPMRSTVALREKLATLNIEDQAPWEVLTLEEGLTLLSDPTLVDSLYAAKPSMNVGLWLRNQMDTIAQEFGWMLMPMPSLSAVRSLREDFDNIRSTLEQQGVQIPSSARGAYRTLRSNQGSFRLYAVTWIVSETADHCEWMLLITLGAEPNTAMPNSLKLSIRDDSELLFEETLEKNDRSVLYAQVLGNWDEKFRVTITANDSDVFEIPPFGFELDESI